MIGMEREISNTTVVTFIEDKLPKSIKVLRCLEIWEESNEIDDSNKLSDFLKLLLKHKRAIEYGSDQLRYTCIMGKGGRKLNREACWLHEDVPGTYHPIWKYREFTWKSVQERNQLVTENKACKALYTKELWWIQRRETV